MRGNNHIEPAVTLQEQPHLKSGTKEDDNRVQHQVALFSLTPVKLMWASCASILNYTYGNYLGIFLVTLFLSKVLLDLVLLSEPEISENHQFDQ